MMTTNCIGCPAHLKICMAECCKQFSFNVEGFNTKQFRRGMVVKFKLPGMSSDVRRYYKLHGLQTSEDTVTVELLAFRINKNKLTIYKKCNALNKEMLCSLHNTGEQPKVCGYPNLEEGVGKHNIYLTTNCLYDKEGGIQRRWQKKYLKTN